MLLLRALKNLISSISWIKKINVGIDLVMCVSLTEITADRVKKKKEEDPRPASQTNGTKVVSKQEVSRKQHLI